MKVGDMVRFAKWEDILDINDWSSTPKKNIGILIKQDTLMKTNLVLCMGELYKVRSQLVEKAGQKDGSR